MTKKYRTTGYDIMPEPVIKKLPADPLPTSRIPVYDAKGNRRGHVGHAATAATVSRFTGTFNNKLGKKDGRTAWLAQRG